LDSGLTVVYLRKRDGDNCAICGKKVGSGKRLAKTRRASIDHIVPVVKGGTNDLENLQLSHLHCNIAKSARAGGQL